MDNVQKQIQEDVQKHKIILYVKGSPAEPLCGFSKVVMDLFTEMGVPFETRDVISNPDIRDGIKKFTNWPTIPQIFINGEFVGGCDIIRDLYESGELETLVKKAVG